MAILINDKTRRKQYTASAGRTVFAYDFEIFDDEDLVVYLTPAGNTPSDSADLLTLTTDYTVSGAGSTGGGNVTLVVPATLNDTITIESNIPIKRLTDYATRGSFLAESINTELDKIVAMLQQLETVQETRSLVLQETAQLSGVSLDIPAPAALNFLRWNAAANALENVTVVTAGSIVVSAYIETLLDDVDAATARATLGINSDVEFTEFEIKDATAPADEQRWRVRAEPAIGRLVIEALNDIGTASAFFVVERTGLTIDSINLGATDVQKNGNTIFSDTPAEFNDLTEKTVVENGDLVVIEDVNAGVAYAKKKVLVENLLDLAAGAQSLAMPGYTTLPGGMILQWGTGTAGASSAYNTNNFPIAFPNACLNVHANFSTSPVPFTFPQTQGYTTTKFDCACNEAGAQNIRWIAIGH